MTTRKLDDARGFGGARVISIEDLINCAEVGDCVYFGVGNEINRAFGKSNEKSPIFIRQMSARMHPWTDHENRPCWDIGVLSNLEGQDLFELIVEITAMLSHNGFRPVMIACDHLASYAAVCGLGKEVHYIYFDAHLDLGLHEGPKGLHNGNFIKPLIDKGHIISATNIGARSWSNHGKDYNSQNLVSILPTANPDATIQALSVLKGERVYVSIDTDVLDPAMFPFSSCPEPFGMTHYALRKICEWIGKNLHIIGGDLSEFYCDTQDNWPAEVLMTCMTALFERDRG